MLSDGLYYVNLPYACFGIEAVGGSVVNAAPIARWMVGKLLATVEHWVRGKRGTIERIEWR